MATPSENLQARYDAITEILASGKTPDGQSLDAVNVSIDGEVVPTDQYVDRLYRELERINTAKSHAAASGGAAPTVISKIFPR